MTRVWTLNKNQTPAREKKMKISKVMTCALALGLGACDTGGNGDAAGPEGISADDIARHVAVLASDEFRRLAQLV